MNTDKNKKIHDAARRCATCFRNCGRTQERSVGKILCEVSKESTVTVVH